MEQKDLNWFQLISIQTEKSAIDFNLFSVDCPFKHEKQRNLAF